jgi:hypothetical protein
MVTYDNFGFCEKNRFGIALEPVWQGFGFGFSIGKAKARPNTIF